ncbi:MAG: HNH endonuclease [Actinomycetota bacterium]
MAPLPQPGSDTLMALVPNAAVRVVYEVLYEHRQEGLTMLELRALALPRLHALGLTDQQEQLDRRKRDLHPHFEIDKSGSGKTTKHRLVRLKDVPSTGRKGISLRTRAEVLKAKRCAMCGRTPFEDEIRLVVDHRIPLDWGGTDDIENLQPLCEECNAGKKAHFASFDANGDAIRAAISYNEPHRRIGELLKALEGQDVRGDLIGMVASAGTFQEDWQKRLRELRTLGWVIKSSIRKEAKRHWAYYRLEHWEAWPEGNIGAEIRRRERLREEGS